MKTTYNVYEDDVLYEEYDDLAEAKETAKFIRESIGAPVSIYKETVGDPVQVDATTKRWPLVSSVRIPF